MARASNDDPRSIVTPDAFQVAPELLGLPLAPPFRRLLALLLDLLLIAILSQLGATVLAVTAVAFFIVLGKRGKGSRPTRGGRILLGCLGVLVFLVAVPAVVGVVALLRSDGGRAAVSTGTRSPSTPQLLSLVGGLSEAISLRQVQTPEEALPIATSLVERARGLGVPEEELDPLLREFLPQAPWVGEVVREVLGSVPPTPPGGAVATEGAPIIPGVEAPAEVPEGSQSTVEEGGGAGLQGVEDSLSVLSRRIAELEAGNASLTRTVRELRAAAREGEGSEGFLMRLVRGVFEDLGLAFGFGTIYLTVFTAWWAGRTPGKRVFGLRVVQLDGRPLSWWASFERAGGYAAGLATGLLGFAQILWDPNRQAIHDRISSTVVVLDGRPPVPGRWRGATDLDPGRGVEYGFDGETKG